MTAERRPARPEAARWIGAALLLAALTAWITWPQVGRLGDSVYDLGDPLLNAWTLAWVAHQLPRDPLHLFDANIFHPESRTLAYSESLVVPGLMTAPLLWAGGNPVLAHNALLLSGFILSGLGTFLLLRSITGRNVPAVFSAIAFAAYPARFDHYAQLQLQMTMWMPLALWAVHRAAASGRVRDGLAAGAFVALQALSCFYYGLFFSAFLVVFAAVLLVLARAGRRAAGPLAAGALAGALIVIPFTLPYWTNRQLVGERGLPEVARGSASLADYLVAPVENVVHGRPERPGLGEHRLFPGATLVTVAAAGLWPPLGAVRAAYGAALVFAFEASRGSSGWVYPLLYAYVPPFRALRVPARFAMIVGLALAVLGGLAVARLFDRLSPPVATTMAVSLCALLVFESRTRPLELTGVPRPTPPVYGWLARQPPSVVFEYPIAGLQGRLGPQDPTYMYFSTRHWQRLVNGYSGFFPPSYFELLDAMRTFPDDRSIAYLQKRGVDFIVVHSAFYIRNDYAEHHAQLSARSDVVRVGAFPWKTGVSQVYRVVHPGRPPR